MTRPHCPHPFGRAVPCTDYSLVAQRVLYGAQPYHTYTVEQRRHALAEAIRLKTAAQFAGTYVDPNVPVRLSARADAA